MTGITDPGLPWLCNQARPQWCPAKMTGITRKMSDVSDQVTASMVSGQNDRNNPGLARDLRAQLKASMVSGQNDRNNEQLRENP